MNKSQENFWKSYRAKRTIIALIPKTVCRYGEKLIILSALMVAQRVTMYYINHRRRRRKKLAEVQLHVVIRFLGCVCHQGSGGHGRKWRGSHHLRWLQLGVDQSCLPAGAGRLPVRFLHPHSAGGAEAGAQWWRCEFASFNHLEVFVTVVTLIEY